MTLKYGESRDPVFLADEAATLSVAGHLAQSLSDPVGVVYLEGPLGAGKTCFVRGFLRALGWQDAVKSPTYTLVEPYEWTGYKVYHFDLYRLGDPEELEFMGIRDYINGDSLCFVEWPARGAGVLAEPDVVLTLGEAAAGRQLAWRAMTSVGEQWSRALAAWQATGGRGK